MSRSTKLTRRSFLGMTAKGIAVVSTGAGFVPLLEGCAPGSSDSGNGEEFDADENGLPAPKNVILITADDLGWKDLACYGNSEISTPNIDRLANEGVRFENAFVTASSCSPSRATFITGQYPHTNGVDGLTTTYPEKSLPPGYKTLPSILKEAGFKTAIEGKWHVAGFEDTADYGYGERLGSIIEMIIASADKTVEFIERNRDERFYLEINYLNNHRDVFSGGFEFDPDFPVDPESVSVPEYWRLPNWPEIRLEVAQFYSQTMKMDHMIGQVLKTLDDLGLAQETMVIFVSDNGPPFPGNKMTLYDRGIGTPLIVRWPEAMVGGTDGNLISTVDLAPTILDALGLPTPTAMQGGSFVSLLSDPGSKPTRVAIYAEMTYHVKYLPTRAVRNLKWKYIRNYSDNPVGLDQCSHMEWAQRLVEQPDQPWTSPRVPEELYDLENDPHEQNNLAEDRQYLDVLEHMQQLLDRHMEETGDPFLGKPFTHDYEEPE